MLRLLYSNRTEELLGELAARVRAEQECEGALVPVRLVVPNGAVERYLRMGIARACGIAGNLDVSPMTRFATETLGRANQVRIAGADHLQAMALTLLLDEDFLRHSDLAPVRAYVSAGMAPEAADVRRVQLAARIAQLFEQYGYSRPALLESWSRGTSLGDRHAEAERWQRHFWLAMFGERGLARERRLLPLHEAIATLGVAAGDAAGPVHVFGFAHFAPAFHRMFAQLSRGSDVVVYTLSPCEGFWEDFDPREPLPLQLWARPGREHVRALNAGAAFDHDDRFVEPTAISLLGRLQGDLMRRRVPSAGSFGASGAADDGSLRFLAHASVRRELEAVASQIWTLLEGDETLRFDDFTVLVPERSTAEYLAHLPAVFREAHEIPHHTVDLAGPDDEGVTGAVRLLLSLPLGRFTRHEVLAVALHPAIAGVVDDADPSRWLDWCDALGVVHGADRSDHRETYIERDILNWDQGLRRLALGAFMSGDASGQRAPFETGGESYVPQEVAVSEVRDAAGFGLLVRSLLADARFIQGSTLSLREWSSLLCTLVETYVTPSADGEAEELARCLRHLHALRDLDLGAARVPFRVAIELARDRVGTWDRGRASEGVVVSRLGSARPMPSRVVFVCGMGEGKFPSGEAEDPLDLRWARRVEGDVTPRDRDRYAFLEVLLCARDRVALSYVSRDPLTGDALEPSSVLEELRIALGRDYVDDVSRLERRHPLRRWDPQYFPDLFADDAGGRPGLGRIRLPEARSEARTLALRRSAEAAGALPDRATVEARASTHPEWAALAEHLGLVAIADRAAPAEGRIAVTMNTLVKFLEFPLHGWARFRLGLDEIEQDDALARDNEPFETRARDETLLLRQIFFATPEGSSFEPAYDATAHERELRGEGPTGVFAQGERSEHLRALQVWAGQLESQSISRGSAEVHRFGRAGERSVADHVHPPLVIEVDVPDARGVVRLARVEIGGRTLPVARATTPTGEESVSVTLAKRIKETPEEWATAGRQRSALRAFIDHAVLSASGVGEGRPHGALVANATLEDPQLGRVSFGPWSRGDATSWLRGLVRELLSGLHAYFLPAEAVLLWRNKEPSVPLVRCIESARARVGDGDGPFGLRSAYGPVPRPHEYPAPSEDEAAAMVGTRFGAIFEKWEERS